MQPMVLLVSADSVAGRLMLSLPLDLAVSTRIEQAITDAQSKVQLALGRPLEATQETLTALWYDETYPLTDHRAWPEARRLINDRYRVDSQVANAEDPTLYDVTFNVGLDVAGDPELDPILQFIGQDAAERLSADPLFTAVARVVSSVSAGGQSVSYESSSRATGATGSLLTINDLKRWKRHTIYQPPMSPREPWPYAYRAR